MATLIRTIVLGVILAGLPGLPVRAQSAEAEKAFGEGAMADWNHQNDTAIAAYTRALALDPTYVIAYCNRCSVYEKLGQWNLALADINHALALDPKFGDAYLIRANVYLDMQEPKKALPDLNRSIERHPLSNAFNRRAEIYFDLGEYDLAIKDYTQAISPTTVTEPPDPDLLDNSVAVLDTGKEQPYYYRGLAHQKLGQLADAEADLRKAAELDPAVAAQLAQTKASASPPAFVQAVQAYANAVGDEPADDGAYFNHARPGFPLHDFPAALTNLNTTVAQDPGDAQTHIDRGYAEFKLNDYQRSIDDVAYALRIKPNNPSAYNNRGLVYLTTGDFDRAIDDYNEVIHLLFLAPAPADPHRQAMAYCGLGKAFGLKGDDVNARACFNLAVSTAPDLAIVYRFRADYEAGDEKDAEALADYAHAVQLNPQSAEAMAGQAWVLTTSKVAALRNPGAAVADASKACDFTAWNDPDMLCVLAAACAATGNFADAQKRQAQAVAICDREPDQAADAEAKRILGLYQAQKVYSPAP